ncbi:hypothetical protein [Streptomyces sp. MI02-7b]|uniref:hypothetical protein n=1 Tax=Streptomyces sp. MI02-7b TaxID=462941 RepID=UPI0029B8CD04|nr:hypothetical protein [Streptomyces sp. MI02-7b]MDX3074632.1 hypothetical protein [Streptomyces sp. MI02-7b]
MRCAAARRARQMLGRRGTFLLVIGIGKVCFGLGMIVQPPQPQGLQLLTHWAPLHCWAWVWILAGTVTTASAFLRIGRDSLGFLAALVPPGLWAFAYGTAAVLGDYPRGAWIFGWYLTSHVGVILWASTLPEYELPHVRARKAA